ncbi:Prostaglandin reductase 1 [Bulinus truncatus]|nr:Prostaglandin reductase 1 [Bulinus truncatus]
MTKAKVWTLRNLVSEIPKIDDFELTEETLPTIKDNEILLEAVYLSVDPYMRTAASSQKVLHGEQVARIIDSKAPNFPTGSLVCAHVGWRSHTVVDVTTPQSFGTKLELLPENVSLSPSLWLGAAGMPGVTAYLAFLERCNPKEGEITVVSAASGAAGSIVGQLAKLRDQTVIGIAGSTEKCEYIKQLGFDYAINYKQDDINRALDEAAPSGVDIYFDNVGGRISDLVYQKLRERARVLICGRIALGNNQQEKGINWHKDILYKQLSIQGFIVLRQDNLVHFPRARQELIKLLLAGKLKTKEHITKGFDQMPKAFIELFTGQNFGKAIVVV